MNHCVRLKLFFTFAAALLLLATGSYAQVHTSNTYRYILTKEDAMEHLKFFTSERIAGRGTGTPQAKEVADYIAAKLESYGAIPFRSVSYFQPFFLPGGKSSQQGGSVSYTEQYRRVTGAAEVGADARKGYNIVGYLPSGRKDAPYIVIGAHYDHIGIIDGKVYPGADDNASGVAALLEVARMFGQRYLERGDLEANIVFVAFDGNNFSLQGSRHFVSKLGIPAGRITCMVNIDQIGSVLSPVGENPEYLLVLGGNKLKGWQKEQLDFANDWFGLGLEIDYTYYGLYSLIQTYKPINDTHNNLPCISIALQAVGYPLYATPYIFNTTPTILQCLTCAYCRLLCLYACIPDCICLGVPSIYLLID